jgi:hypothetical protein
MAARLNIPEQVRLKLWVHSGGRCEFPNCNEPVWRDDTTQKEDNFAHMAHIVAASPNGPRGDEELSSELQTDYDNLMLVCLKHSRLIDGRNAESYTIEQLRGYKQKHEERIQRQTAIGVEGPTAVLRFNAPIGDRRVEIAPADIFPAVQSRPLADDKGVWLDFSHKAGRGDEAFWTQFSSEVTEQLRQSLRRGNDGLLYGHLSVFALAPIPILLHLGNQLGNIVPVDLYQKHRDTDDWKWKDEPVKDDFAFRVTRTEGADHSKVALVLSLSGKNGPEMYRPIVGDAPVYEIEVDGPNPGFLPYKSRLEKFRTTYRQVLSEIGAKYGGSTICLFPAIPAPVAVLCGKELLPKADPTMRVYDRDQGVFVPTLTIN